MTKLKRAKGNTIIYKGTTQKTKDRIPGAPLKTREL
jgi:hypothetical protein